MLCFGMGWVCSFYLYRESDCDKIIILDEGGINDIGTHEELLLRNEIYKDIYDSQQKGSDDFDVMGGAL